MLCSHCGRNNVEEASYCIDCGRALQLSCPGCGTKNPGDAKYCSACGTVLEERVDGAAAEQQREPQKLSCPRCHSLNELGSRFCADCGFPLDELTSEGLARRGNQPDRIPAWELGRPAGFWIRAVANLFDGIFILLATALLAAVFFQENYFSTLADETVIWSSGDTVNLLVGAAYAIIMVALVAGTVGKLMLGMHIVHTDGSRVGFGTATLRFLAQFLSFLLLGIGYLMVAFRRDKRGLHDLLCDTVVVIVRN